MVSTLSSPPQEGRVSAGQSGRSPSRHLSGTESRVRGPNADITLDRLVEALMEPVGRQARRQVAEAIRRP
jgi:hypothetical protein